VASSSRTPLGIKQIAPDNWLRIDPAWAGIVMPGSRPDPAEAWIAEVMSAQLSERVPLEVRKLTEVARGAVAYGLFFYPLLTLGTEQLYRVLETAAITRRGNLSGQKKRGDFRGAVAWLIKRRVISANNAHQWRSFIDLRHAASHPVDQTIMPPSWAMGLVSTVVELINEIFEAPSTAKTANPAQRR
jgi:hypothetical protein